MDKRFYEQFPDYVGTFFEPTYKSIGKSELADVEISH